MQAGEANSTKVWELRLSQAGVRQRGIGPSSLDECQGQLHVAGCVPAALRLRWTLCSRWARPSAETRRLGPGCTNCAPRSAGPPQRNAYHRPISSDRYAPGLRCLHLPQLAAECSTAARLRRLLSLRWTPSPPRTRVSRIRTDPRFARLLFVSILISSCLLPSASASL